MQRYLIKNISRVNEGKITLGDILLEGGRFEQLGGEINPRGRVTLLDGSGRYLLPGIIDDQVHFREPGLTEKATIHSESRAAVAGGVTSFMEMPNTRPPALTQDLLEEKYRLASVRSLANYSFYMGVSNDNSEQVLRTNEKEGRVCGIKIFLGSSTGNMLVDNYLTLERIFSGTPLLIATHCEDERIIRDNLNALQAGSGRVLGVQDHPLIRNAEACYRSSLSAVQLAMKHGSRLHILHISTERELSLFSNLVPLEEKRITSEVCVHHLYFSQEDYPALGNLIKCNPAIKTSRDRDSLLEGLLDDRLDIIATDHAPHSWSEKQEPYSSAPSGLPLVQHGLLMMLEFYRKGRITLERIVDKMCHDPARCFRVEDRGYIREGYFGDCFILDLGQQTTVSKENLAYKCGWSPLEGRSFPGRITHTFVNGELVFSPRGWEEGPTGMRLAFRR